MESFRYLIISWTTANYGRFPSLFSPSKILEAKIATFTQYTRRVISTNRRNIIAGQTLCLTRLTLLPKNRQNTPITYHVSSSFVELKEDVQVGDWIHTGMRGRDKTVVI